MEHNYKKHVKEAFDELLERIKKDPALALAIKNMGKDELIDLATAMYESELEALEQDKGEQALITCFEHAKQQISKVLCSHVLHTNKEFEALYPDWNSAEQSVYKNILTEAFRLQLRELQLSF